MNIKLLIDLHKNTERQGPGGTNETIKALDFIQLNKNREYNIADIGCGIGAQTLTLAENSNAKIVAVDLSAAFLDELKISIQKRNLNHRIKTQVASMDNLPFQNEEFDIIWSEGAVYNMGFEHGIRYWKQFLKQGGYLAVSEISWITDWRPKEVETYWKNEYAEIGTISEKTAIIEKNGYCPVAHFVLPESCWLDNYYKPREKHFSDFLARHDDSEAAKQMVEETKREMELYERYKKYFSYGFYVARKL
ncbi:MAG: methyltransferase domain-containing protein [Bacteroidales bacterium]|jgi:cyclopropane fatty-acyl-phospholipid synthase-like methyltransferase|nr:methyltransferase domain-containing protein [Bacteroidales bacterium]